VDQMLYNIGYFAAAGAVGGIIGAIISRFLFKDYAAPVIAVCVITSIAVARYVEQPSVISDADIEQNILDGARGASEEGYQLLRTMESVSPELYRSVIDDLINRAREQEGVGDIDRDEIARALRAYMTAYVDERLPYLSDLGIYQYANVGIEQINVMADLGLNDICYRMALGQDFGAVAQSDRLLELEAQLLRIVALDPLNGSEVYTEEVMVSF